MLRHQEKVIDAWIYYDEVKSLCTGLKWVCRHVLLSSFNNNSTKLLHYNYHRRVSLIMLRQAMCSSWLQCCFHGSLSSLSERSRWPVSRALIRLLSAIELTSGGCEASAPWRGKTWERAERTWAARHWRHASQHMSAWCFGKVSRMLPLPWMWLW